MLDAVRRAWSLRSSGPYDLDPHAGFIDHHAALKDNVVQGSARRLFGLPHDFPARSWWHLALTFKTATHAGKSPDDDGSEHLNPKLQDRNRHGCQVTCDMRKTLSHVPTLPAEPWNFYRMQGEAISCFNRGWRTPDSSSSFGSCLGQVMPCIEPNHEKAKNNENSRDDPLSFPSCCVRLGGAR